MHVDLRHPCANCGHGKRAHRHGKNARPIGCKLDRHTGCQCRQYVSATRARILVALAENGAMRSEDLALAAGVRLSALRGHLHRLERDRLVRLDFVPLGMGRPKLYAWLAKTPRASSFSPTDAGLASDSLPQ